MDNTRGEGSNQGGSQGLAASDQGNCCRNDELANWPCNFVSFIPIKHKVTH